MKIRRFQVGILGLALGLLLSFRALPETQAAEAPEEGSQSVFVENDDVVQTGGMTTVFFDPGEEVQPLALETTWQKALRERILSSISQYRLEIDVLDLQIPYSEENFQALNQVVSDCLNSHPEYFYVSGGCSFTFYQCLESLTLSPMPRYYGAGGGADWNVELARGDKEAYEENVRSALSYVTGDMTELERALALHDYLVRECDYLLTDQGDPGVDQMKYTAYGAIVNRQAVCNGYSLAYSDLLRRVGISSMLVSSPAMNHAWNLVQIDGSWYHVDTTWDDPIWIPDGVNNDSWKEGFVGHTYFVRSDDEILSLEHYGWDTSLCPAADQSNRYDSYVFRENDSAEYYFGGYWYYLGNDLRVTRARLDGTGRETLDQKSQWLYMHKYGDYFYLANQTGLYLAPVSDAAASGQMMDFASRSEYLGYYLTEFTIKGSDLVVVLYNNEQNRSLRQLLPMNPFADVNEGDWYFRFSLQAYHRNIMSGKGVDGAGKVMLAPLDPVTRAEFVQILYTKTSHSKNGPCTLKTQ